MLLVTELWQAVSSGGLSSPASYGNFLEPHSNSPPLYNGDPNSCRSFLAQCTLVFSLQAGCYATEEARIAFVLTLLTGQAREWGMAVWENQAPCCRSFRALNKEMTSLFDRSARGDEAAAQLSQLSQRRLASSLADPPLSSVRTALVCPVVPSPWVQEDPSPAPLVVAVEAAAPLEAADNAAAPHSWKQRRRRRKKTSSSLQDSEVVPERTADRGVVLALTKLLAFWRCPLTILPMWRCPLMILPMQQCPLTILPMRRCPLTVMTPKDMQ
ncbi:Pol poly [Labeo rohita]|uniref:Pol poly n=1 Tax=Labeo rohita TaxID=84645 RepID=A0A498ME59_LABRO|nr:Pol poly [Labeo rohita]RXN38164.1 Pol poly [Labeo rohita]